VETLDETLPNKEQDFNGSAPISTSGAPNFSEKTEINEAESESLETNLEKNKETLNDDDMKVNLAPENDASYLVYGLEKENPWLSDFLTNCAEGLEDPNAGIALVLAGPKKIQAAPALVQTGGNNDKGVSKRK
jgi:hypothetical protein